MTQRERLKTRFDASCMSNERIDVTRNKREPFDCVLALFSKAATIGYRTVPNMDGKRGDRIVLYWAESAKMTKLPFPMGEAAIADFLWAWLQQADYGAEPDHDGHNTRGWRIYCGAWGHVDDEWEAYCAVEAVWAEHGK